MLNNENVVQEAVYSIIPKILIEQVLIFGSMARGDANYDSDTDICVITKDELTRDEIKTYRYNLNKLFATKYRMPVDILIKSSSAFERYKNVAGAIEYAIAREGVSL